MTENICLYCNMESRFRAAQLSPFAKSYLACVNQKSVFLSTRGQLAPLGKESSQSWCVNVYILVLWPDHRGRSHSLMFKQQALIIKITQLQPSLVHLRPHGRNQDSLWRQNTPTDIGAAGWCILKTLFGVAFRRQHSTHEWGEGGGGKTKWWMPSQTP